MCGIAGIFNADRTRSVDGKACAAMAATLRHRGPDDAGRFTAPGVALGFTRLSIIDLGGGNQPHSNEDESVVSVCNGEIYNHKALRAQPVRCRSARASLRTRRHRARQPSQRAVRLRGL